ncbi:T9SS type A sorting domain-containing protein [Vicingaceae bacterium]|nr:T9SS type A sorting domain-containing protein [Vicingaceae bacterium]
MKKILFQILLFGIYCSGFSQTGPAGIGNCTLWLKADLGTKNSAIEITTAGLLDEWQDQSGSGNHASSATISPFKTQDNSSAEKIMNFNPVVVFDHPNDGFSGPNLGMDGSNTLSEFYVLKSAPAATPAPVTNYLAVFSLGNVITGPYNSAHRLENDPLGGSYMLFDYAWGDNLASAASSDSYYTQAIKSAVYDGITFLGYANGRQVSTKTTNIGISGAGSYKIGDCEPAAGGPQSTFSAGEIIIFNTNINPTQRKQVDSYLGIKYGVTLNNNGGGTEGDYLAANGTTTIWDASLSPSYHNNVIGVVRDDAYPLTQKQSQTLDDTTRVYRGTTLQTTNLANTSSIADASYFMIGDNQGEMNSTVSSNAEIPGTCGLLTRIEREWKVTRTSVGGSFSIDITLSPFANPGSVSVSDLRLIVDDNGDFSSGTTNCYSNGSGVTITYSNPVISITGINTAIIPNNSTRYITVGSADEGTSLPVELLSFEAECSDNNVALNWVTASEINNDYFTIERSPDADNFETVGTVNGSGNGNNSNYTLNDDNPISGTTYYRLKQTDFNGAFEYHGVRAVTCEQTNSVSIYPNPATNQIIIKGIAYELEEIVIYNTLGQNVTLLINQVITNENQLVIDMSKLNTGMYYVKTKTTANKVYKQ